ncbi:hypothetical protein ACFQMA_13810 [Halosimplex aquaticum]|uniref:ABC-2 type transport system permease protein n=1 Tax=Halosimplex aquaticum TaxID=3026162 RepID=A0ABD5Y0H4_9EURY|nr:hypothetical protein [Halosimplex aquaticum]
MTSDEGANAARLLTFDAYTDDTAPDYDGLAVAYVTVVSALLVAMTVGVVWVLEDGVVGRLAADGFGYGGPFESVVVGFGVLAVSAAVLAAGRYASVRAIDGNHAPTAVGVTLVQVAVYGVLATVALEVFVVIVTDRLLLVGGAAATGLAVLGALAVLATDWDLSWTASAAVVVLGIAGLLALVSAFVWDASTDGLLWWTYLRIWDVIKYVCAPAFFGLAYVHDVWRVSERGLSPTVGAMATYTAVAGLFLIPIEYVVGAVKLAREN